MTKDTLWHINWGDGDTSFVIAPDKETAISRMPDGRDMINTIVRLDGLYGLIFKAGIEQEHKAMIAVAVDEGNKAYKVGIREVVDKLKEHPDFYRKMLDTSPDWQAQLKEWGIK